MALPDVVGDQGRQVRLRVLVELGGKAFSTNASPAGAGGADDRVLPLPPRSPGGVTTVSLCPRQTLRPQNRRSISRINENGPHGGLSGVITPLVCASRSRIRLEVLVYPDRPGRRRRRRARQSAPQDCLRRRRLEVGTPLSSPHEAKGYSSPPRGKKIEAEGALEGRVYPLLLGMRTAAGRPPSGTPTERLPRH